MIVRVRTLVAESNGDSWIKMKEISLGLRGDIPRCGDRPVQTSRAG
jgi:hypothetical protein